MNWYLISQTTAIELSHDDVLLLQFPFENQQEQANRRYNALTGLQDYDVDDLVITMADDENHALRLADLFITRHAIKVNHFCSICGRTHVTLRVTS